MKQRNIFSATLLFVASIVSFSQLLISPALAATPEEKTPEEVKGFEVAARSDRSDRGFGDSEAEMTMVLRNAAGQESSRTMRFTTLEIPDESVGDKSLVLFSTPRDIEGTALLSH
ncbi:MAG: hypothetical protein V7722_09375, partial [Porticoccus sp.]